MLIFVEKAQDVMRDWCISRFGAASLDPKERAMRVLEEALELAQAEGIGRDDVRRLETHVYSKPIGKPDQEAAGVMVCMLAWAAGRHVDLWGLTMVEIERIVALPAEHFRKRHRIKADAGVALPVEDGLPDDA